jgi:hypothetical protein
VAGRCGSMVKLQVSGSWRVVQVPPRTHSNRPLTCGNASGAGSCLDLWDHLWDHAPVAVNFPVTAGDTVGLRAARCVAGSAKGTPMAQWVRRSRTDGGESIQIKWRLDGRWQSETFTDARTAVELAGHRWPEGWVRGRAGLAGTVWRSRGRRSRRSLT